MSPAMTSVSQEAHVIHDSGSWFDKRTRFRHTDIEKHLENNNIAVGSMRSKTSEEDSTCVTEFDNNMIVRDLNIETSSKFMSEVDFESLVTETSYDSGKDSTITTNENSNFFLELLNKDVDSATRESAYGPNSMPCEENIPGNSDIDGKHLANGLCSYRRPSKTNPAINRIVLQSTSNTDCIYNSNDRFPNRQKFDRSSTVSQKKESVKNDGSIYIFKRYQKGNTGVISTHNNEDKTKDGVVHGNSETSDSPVGYVQFRKDKTNFSSVNNNFLNVPMNCVNVDMDNIRLVSEEPNTKSEGALSETVSSIGSQCFDKDNKASLTADSRMKAMFINNWTQGLPQTGHTNNLLQPEEWDGISYTFPSHSNDNSVVHSPDDSTFNESNLFPSTLLDEGETECPFLPVGKTPRKDSCCSISSLSSFSVSDYLLGSSKNSSPYGSLLHSIEGTVDKESCQSRRSSLTNNKNTLSRRSSITFEDLSRRSSAVSRQASPIIDDMCLKQSDDERPNTRPAPFSSSSSQCSRTSSIAMSVDSRPSSPSMKSSHADRRTSVWSDISSISLPGLFNEEGSMLSCSPVSFDDINRTNTPSPSPFGHQLKYFQDKRKNEMFLVKATTARLGLNTRRNSYNLWRENNLDTKGRPILIKPKINVGQKSDVFTKERVTAINLAMEWVREELQQLKEQDESLAHQFLEIRRTIHELKLDWSCESHREMLMDAEVEINEIKNLKRVSDLPEHHSTDGVFRDKRMIRSLGKRKYSIF